LSVFFLDSIIFRKNFMVKLSSKISWLRNMKKMRC